MYFTENLLIEAVYRHAREVILADQRKMNPLKQASLQALISVRQTVTGYAEDYFAFFLVLSIMEKKSRMIITASTKGELQEIVWKLPYRAVPCTGGRGNSVVGGISGGSFK